MLNGASTLLVEWRELLHGLPALRAGGADFFSEQFLAACWSHRLRRRTLRWGRVRRRGRTGECVRGTQSIQQVVPVSLNVIEKSPVDPSDETESK